MILWMLENAPLSGPSLSLYATLSLVEPAGDCISVLHSIRNEKIRVYFRVTHFSAEKNRHKTHLKIVKLASKNKGPQIVSSDLNSEIT